MLKLIKEKEMNMFKTFNEPVTKHFAKLLKTNENDLFFLEKENNTNTFNKINSNSNQIGNMTFKYDNKDYNVKFKSIYGVPFILDNTENNNKIIMSKFDLSRITSFV